MPKLLATSNDLADVAEIRLRLDELGRFQVAEAEGQTPKQTGPPYERTPTEEALYQLSRAPREPVRKAIDQVLRSGTKEERIGALTLYTWIVATLGIHFTKEPLNPSYESLLHGLLEEDDRSSRAYTGSLVSALMLYRSPETVSILMRLGGEAKVAEQRVNYISLAASLAGIDLPIFKQTKPLEKEQIVANFQAWYEQNKDRISFDSEGRPTVKGANPNAKPRALTSQERARIRKDPACVLELLQGSSGGIEVSEERMQKLVDQCGEALYGPEAADKTQAGGSQPFDLQMNLAAARSKYPMLDAALLAVAYVAADDADPKHRELAVMTLDDIGMPEDIVRVLKHETKEVRQKTMQLADENEKAQK